MSEVDAYIAALPAPRGERMQHFMQVFEAALPGIEPKFWNSGSGIIGFGSYHYEYPSGLKGESMQLGLASRARYIAIYASCAEDGDAITAKFKDRLPMCKLGKACIEVPDRATIDDATLAELAQTVFATFAEAKRQPKEPGKTHIWE